MFMQCFFQEYESLEVCAKILFQMELERGDRDADFGFQVEAELAEDTEREDEMCVFVSDTTKGGLAHKKGEWGLSLLCAEVLWASVWNISWEPFFVNCCTVMT